MTALIIIKHGNKRLGELHEVGEGKFIFQTSDHFKEEKSNNCKVNFFRYDRLPKEGPKALAFALDWIVNNCNLKVNNLSIEEYSKDSIPQEIHDLAKKAWENIIEGKLKTSEKIKTKINKSKLVKKIISESASPISAEDIFEKTGLKGKHNRTYVYVLLGKLEKSGHLKSIVKQSPRTSRKIKYYSIVKEKIRSSENKEKRRENV